MYHLEHISAFSPSYLRLHVPPQTLFLLFASSPLSSLCLPCEFPVRSLAALTSKQHQACHPMLPLRPVLLDLPGELKAASRYKHRPSLSVFFPSLLHNNSPSHHTQLPPSPEPLVQLTSLIERQNTLTVREYNSYDEIAHRAHGCPHGCRGQGSSS